MYPTKRELKGYSYGRVSTFDQAFNADGSKRDDASPDAQKKRCQQYVDDLNRSSSLRNEYKIIEHLSDDGFSGKNTNRPSYQKLISAITRREIDFVVAAEISRLSRSVLDFLDFINHCEKNQVDVIIIGLNLDTSTAIGRALITIIISLAQLERETTSERVRANAMTRLVVDGRINGTTETLGLDKDPSRRGHFILNGDEIKTVEQILKIYLDMQSKKKALEKIQALGFCWKDGKPFTKSNLNTVFSNIKYRYRGVWPVKVKGQDRFGDEEQKFVKLPHGPVIDASLLDEVEECLFRNHLQKRRSTKNHAYFLSPLLKHEDGTSFTGQPAKQQQYRYYYNKTNSLRIRCDELDDLIIKRIASYLKQSDVFEKIVKAAYKKRQESLPYLNKKLLGLEHDLEGLLAQEEGLKKSLVGSVDDGHKMKVDGDENGLQFRAWLQESVEKNLIDRQRIVNEIDSVKKLKVEILKPISTEYISNHIGLLLGQFKKLSDTQKRRYAEKIFQKIVIKRDNTIELQLKFSPFAENCGTNSSTRGLNGGANRT